MNNDMNNNDINNNKMNENFNLKDKWVLWFHKINDSNWNIESYVKVYEITTYYDILFIQNNIKNITLGMYFLMKHDITPIFEDVYNVNGGSWSMRITKKECNQIWEKLFYYLCIDNITVEGKYEEYINGFSLNPKINNCIFKVWTSDYHFMKTDYMNKKITVWEDKFYLQHDFSK
jgi:hypothetical protein